MTARIALATQTNLPDWEVDDRPLHAALAARGAEVHHPAWDDPTVAWSGFDAVLIRTTWDYMERRDAYLAWAEQVATVSRLFNPPDVVRWNTHKSYLRDLEARGAALAPTLWFSRGATPDLSALVRERGWARAFLKPQVGASALETLRFTCDPTGLATASAHLQRTLATRDMMLQPYLAAVESEGELSAFFIDGQLSHGVRKVPVPGDYRVQDDFGAHDEPYTFEAEDRALVEGIAALAGPLLYARVDLLRDDGGRLCLNELELVEPSLFFRHAPEAADRLAEALLARAS